MRGGVAHRRPGSRRPLADVARIARPAHTAKLPTLATAAIWLLVTIHVVPDSLIEGSSNAGPGMATQGTMLIQLIWIILLAVGLAVVVPRLSALLQILRAANSLLWVFYLLAAASVLWSIDPPMTAKRVIRLGIVAITGGALAVSPWAPTHFQRILRPTITILLAGSVLFVLLAPGIAIESSTSFSMLGAWRGLTIHKNALGSVAAIGGILWWHAWLTRETPRWQAVLGGAVSGLCLLNSRSSTSLMAAAFAGLFLLLLLRSPRGLRRQVPYLVGSFVAALMIYSLAVLNLIPGSSLLLSPITSVTGKDLTFSGRTLIWEIIDNHIAQRPWLGSGYGAYWVEEPNSPSMEMVARLHFYPTEGHNGYLDIINDLGIVGGACLLGYLVVFLLQGLRIFSVDRSQGALYLTLLLMMMLANLSESRWFNVLDYSFLIMTIATLMMARQLADADPRMAAKFSR